MSILDSSTVNCDRFSHRVGLACHSSASATLLIDRSRKCRPVIHSIELTIAYLRSSSGCDSSSVLASFSNTASVTALFPVDSVP